MLNDLKLNKDPIKIKRALISVYDKTNIINLAKKLNSAGVEIISTGGTSESLMKSNIPVTELDNFTGFPEILDGRVKTLNPLVAGGVLALRDVHHTEAKEHNIKFIDLVICNLYPFAKTISQDDCTLSQALENIDIGGPTMIRSAAKNLGWVCVIVDPNDYTDLVDCIDNNSEVSYDFRLAMACKAFATTSQYETMINNYLNTETFPDQMDLTYKKYSDLRY